MANVLTGVRMICALILTACPTFSPWFYALYIAGGISDVLDGIVARRLHKESRFGARLDTVADFVFLVVVTVKIAQKIRIPTWLLIWVLCVAVLKIINLLIGLILHRRFFSEHTVLNKICGVLLFGIPVCIGLFPWQPVLTLMISTCGAATVAALQEAYYIRVGKEIH